MGNNKLLIFICLIEYVFIAIGLHRLDECFKLSDVLIDSIRVGLDKHNEMMEWNLRHNHFHLISTMVGYN